MQTHTLNLPASTSDLLAELEAAFPLVDEPFHFDSERDDEVNDYGLDR